MLSSVKRGEFWADKMMDLANLSVVVLVFGQFDKKEYNLIVLLFGIILYVLLFLVSYLLRIFDYGT